MSTSVEYPSPCHYIAPNGELKASETCNITYGLIGVTGNSRYIVSFPNKAEVVVIEYANGEATANEIKCEVAVAGNNNVVVATVQGEVFVFQSSPYR